MTKPPLTENDGAVNLSPREEERVVGQRPTGRKRLRLDAATKAALDELAYVLWLDSPPGDFRDGLLRWKAYWLTY